MKRLLSTVALVLTLTLTTTPPAYAQNWPRPSTKPNTPVPCPVGSSCAGRSIAPYMLPLEFIGRWLDSTQSRDWQQSTRTLRARTIRINTAHGVLFEIQGSMLVAYQFSRFAARIAAGESLSTMPRQQSGEQYLGWDGGYWNVLTQPTCAGDIPAAGCWILHNTDGNDRLYDFDFDDRGYVYVATDPFGWGVLRYDSAVGFANVWQDYPQTVQSNRVLSVHVGTRHYAAVSPIAGPAVLYDVTNPAAPVRVRELPGFDEWAKTSDRVATVSGGRLLIYTAAALVNGSPTVIIGAGAYVSVTTSGDRFVALSRSGQDPVRVRFDAGAEIELGLRYLSGPKIRCSSDYCAIFGYEAYVPGTDLAAAFNLRLFHLAGSSLVAVPLQSGARQAFASLYSAPYAGGSGWAGPTATGDGSGAAGADVRFVTYGGRTVMLAALNGLGDAWYVDGAAPTPMPAPAPQPAPACPAGFQAICVAIVPPQPAPAPMPAPVQQPPAPPPQPAPAPAPAPTPIPAKPCPCSREHLECCR